jgi:hypothetical protein
MNGSPAGRVALVLAVGIGIFGGNRVLGDLPADFSGAVFEDESGEHVRILYPAALANPGGERRLFGTPPPVLGIFPTLHDRARRREAYTFALRTLLVRPEEDGARAAAGRWTESFACLGFATQEARQVAQIIRIGAMSINKRYPAGGTLEGETKILFARLGRKLNTVNRAPAFAAATKILAGMDLGAEIGETVAGAVLDRALATDEAAARLGVIADLVEDRSTAKGAIDSALLEALGEVRGQLNQSQSSFGALIPEVQKRGPALASSSISLGAALAGLSSNPWIWSGVSLWKVAAAVSDQWEQAQNASALATLSALLKERTGGAQDDSLARMTARGEAGAYVLLAAAFESGGARFHDFLSPGAVSRDLSSYYAGEAEIATREASEGVDDVLSPESCDAQSGIAEGDTASRPAGAAPTCVLDAGCFAGGRYYARDIATGACVEVRACGSLWKCTKAASGRTCGVGGDEPCTLSPGCRDGVQLLSNGFCVGIAACEDRIRF